MRLAVPGRTSSVSRMRSAAAIITHTTETGMSSFQPRAMNWSYRSRGRVLRSHTKTNSTTHTLITNHSSGHQPEFAPLHNVNGHGACQPPRNRVVASAETVTMLTYSASMNIANRSDEYSVWKQPTSSPSASGRSKGARLVSPTIDTEYTRKDGSSSTTNHRSFCAATMPEVDIVPACRKTAANASPIAISYEMTCAVERSPPSSG